MYARAFLTGFYYDVSMKWKIMLGLMVLFIAFNLIGVQGLYVNANAGTTVATSNLGLDAHVAIIPSATIVSMDNATITIESEEYSGSLISKGKWIALTSDDAELCKWLEASTLIEMGNATIAMATLSKDNKTINVLLGLKQGDLILIRPKIIKRAIAKAKHGTFEFTCKLVGKVGPFLVVEKKGIRALVLVDPDGKWYKAGYGAVTWREVVNELNVGDALWLCTHNIAILKKGFAEVLGVRALIWGFSGAIIDLTNGIAIAKYPL